MTENTRDTIISIGNNVRDLANSWLKNNFRPAAENSVWIQPVKEEEKKPPVLVILHCLAKKKKKTWLKVLSALFSTVYWSPKTVPWLPAKYICYYGNQSKQGNRRKNRGELKTWLMWIYGSEREFVEVCWKGLILCHMSFFSLCFSPCSYRLKDLTMKHSFKGNMLWNNFCTWSSLSFRF